MVGIAGQSDEKLRVYRTTMSPFGAPDWDHTPFTNTGNQPVAQQCYETAGQVRLHQPRSERAGAMAYGTAEGVWVAGDPRGLHAWRRRRVGRSRRDLARRLGTGRRPGRPWDARTEAPG